MSSTENRQACYPVPAFVLFFSKILIRIESYVTMAGRGGEGHLSPMDSFLVSKVLALLKSLGMKT